jgi:autotransporter-associated beta strand protein
MTFADQNYTVSTTGSAQLTVNSGIIAVSNATLTSASSNQLILGGDNAWDAVGSAVLTVTADVSGPFALTKQGPGTLALDATNTYTGATTVQEGTLTLNSSSALPTGGNVIVSGGVLDLNGHSPTIGNLTFGDGLSTLAATFGDGAAVQGSATLNGNITYSWTIGTSYFPAATLSANLLLASGTHQITTADSSISANYDIVISGTMGGSGGIEKDGVNYIALAAANTYSGPTAINNGWLFLTAADAIPSNSDIIVNSPGVLSLNPTNTQTGVTTGNYNQSAGSLAGNGQIELGSATLAVGNDNSSTAYSGSIFGSGGLTKTGTGTLTISSALSYTGTTFINSGAIQISTNGGLSGVVSGSNGGILIYNWGSNSVLMSNTLTGGVGLTQAGSGGLYVTGASSYTGTTSISSGAIYIGDGSTTGSLGTGPVVNNGTLYFYRSNSFTVSNAISGSGNLYQDGAGTVTLTGSNSYLGSTLLASGFFQLGNGGATGSLPGSSTVQGNSGTGLVFDRSDNITLGNSIISGIGVTQSGSGSVTLTAAESYTGPTTVTSGSLVINGSISGSPTTVSGGTLGGNGTLGSVSVLSGGAILPATSGTVGLLSLGNFSLASGATFDIQLDGTTGTGTAAVSYDELKTAGTVTLGGAVQLSIMSGFTPVIGDVFYAILNDSSDTVSGTFSNAVGDTLTFPGGYIYTVNYAASGYSTSNDVSFTLTAIPEPSLPASLATGLLLLAGYFRIRRPSKRQRISGARYEV